MGISLVFCKTSKLLPYINQLFINFKNLMLILSSVFILNINFGNL
jgi:hypothetical protein